MGSAVSTNPVRRTTKECCFAVSPAARVRKEAFGLVFFNTRESRLTFVRCGDLLRIEAGPCGRKKIAAQLEGRSREKVKRLLDHLLRKGLIGEA